MLKERMQKELERVQVFSIAPVDLLEKSWDFYVESFPEGYCSYLRDFEEDQFKSALLSPDFIKFYLVEKGEILAFSLITKNEKAMEMGTDRDPAFFRKKVPEANGKLFWISLFMVKDQNNLTPKAYAPMLAVKVFSHIFDEGCMVAFSQELEETPTMLAQIKRACRKFMGIEIGNKEISHEVTSVMWKM
jgi:hypothetical protein